MVCKMKSEKLQVSLGIHRGKLKYNIKMDLKYTRCDNENRSCRRCTGQEVNMAFANYTSNYQFICFMELIVIIRTFGGPL